MLTDPPRHECCPEASDFIAYRGRYWVLIHPQSGTFAILYCPWCGERLEVQK